MKGSGRRSTDFIFSAELNIEHKRGCRIRFQDKMFPSPGGCVEYFDSHIEGQIVTCKQANVNKRAYPIGRGYGISFRSSLPKDMHLSIAALKYRVGIFVTKIASSHFYLRQRG